MDLVSFLLWYFVLNKCVTAALLIQGSTCVYIKKIEYLHALVYKALEVISNKKKQKQTQNQQAVDIDVDADDIETFFEDDEHFLNLDDALEGMIITQLYYASTIIIQPCAKCLRLLKLICSQCTYNRGGRYQP